MSRARFHCWPSPMSITIAYIFYFWLKEKNDLERRLSGLNSRKGQTPRRKSQPSKKKQIREGRANPWEGRAKPLRRKGQLRSLSPLSRSIEYWNDLTFSKNKSILHDSDARAKPGQAQATPNQTKPLRTAPHKTTLFIYFSCHKLWYVVWPGGEAFQKHHFLTFFNFFTFLNFPFKKRKRKKKGKRKKENN